ncbi:MAG TPA: hypothetical protein VNK41_05660 [Vicinamibacterales bacterium]|nr:hypothetical protein [Vicinamibacterales bacterium]
MARWIRNRRPPRPSGPRRIAGVLAARNYDDRCGVFHTLAHLCDVTIVLDDDSDRPFPWPGECTEYIALRREAPWNAPANLTLLLYRAFVNGCEWVLSLDDDVILSHGIRDRSSLAALVDGLESQRIDVCHLPLRDLWNSEDRYRTDGVWGRKTFPVLRRNWFFYDGLMMPNPRERLHAPAFPPSLRCRWTIDRRHAVYHTGCLTAEARRERVDRYAREDPDRVFQRDYSYMLDEGTLETAEVPAADLQIIRQLLGRQFPRR